MLNSPSPPVSGGRQLGGPWGYRKGAGGQGIGFRPMTAAAKGPVTFGPYFYWSEARLLDWWGSSCAAGKSRAAKGRPYDIQEELPVLP